MENHMLISSIHFQSIFDHPRSSMVYGLLHLVRWRQIKCESYQCLDSRWTYPAM